MQQELISTSAGRRAVTVPLGSFDATGTLAWPEHPSGVVIIARALGRGPDVAEQAIAHELRRAGLATLQLDLLPVSPESRPAVAGPEVLAARLLAAAEWVMDQPEVEGLVPGYLASDAAAAAALRAAGEARPAVGAVVCIRGRPDLAGDALATVDVPVLLITGGRDRETLEPNRRAYRRLDCTRYLLVMDGARLDEPGAYEEAGRRAAGWLVEHLAMAPRWRERRYGFSPSS